jgi:hypothetical protein
LPPYSKLRCAGTTPKTGVAGVTGVAGDPATCAKSLELQWLRPLRLKTDKAANDVNRGVVGDVAAPPEPDQAELEERKALAMDAVPGPYLDAWARLQVQKPVRVSDAEWRQAIDDVGRFLDQWGSMAAEFQWTAWQAKGRAAQDDAARRKAHARPNPPLDSRGHPKSAIASSALSSPIR